MDELILTRRCKTSATDRVVVRVSTGIAAIIILISFCGKYLQPNLRVVIEKIVPNRNDEVARRVEHTTGTEAGGVEGTCSA